MINFLKYICILLIFSVNVEGDDTEKEIPICDLPIDRGSCSESHQQYAYSSVNSTCLSFSWSGCGGNLNRFATLKDCQTSCAGLVDLGRDETNHVLEPEITGKLGFDPAMCKLDVDEGMGLFSEEHYAFFTNTSQCEKFIFTGFGGNKNKFDTLEECIEFCITPDTPRIEGNGGIVTGPRYSFNKRICNMPIKTGTCDEKFCRFGYSPKLNRCRSFRWSGCGENENNFNTLDECRRTCGGLINRSKRELQNDLDEDEGQTNSNNETACHLPISSGSCDANQTMYGFSEKDQECQIFSFGGCGGNANRFNTLQNCKNVCLGTSGESSDPSLKIASRRVKNRKRKPPCYQPTVIGFCKAKHPRYTYNKMKGTCEKFYYGGCMGNDNNFMSKRECEAKCVRT